MMDDSDSWDSSGSDVTASGGTFGSGDDVVDAPQGFGERFANSFGAILVGIVLVPLACAGLFWNEWHAVHVARALDETGKVVQSVSSERFDPALNGKPIHVAGETTSAKGVADEAMGVKAKGLKLSRHVEMYQWREKESGSGQDRKFIYSREWSDSAISSGSFHAPGHANPAFPYRSKDFGAADAMTGAVPIGALATVQLGSGEELPVDESGLAAVQKTAGKPAQLSGGGYYVGRSIDAPTVGDTRITFKVVREGPASFIGRQEKTGLEAYRATNGEEILLAYPGTYSAAGVIQKGQDDNAILAWILRAVGMVVLLIGFAMLFAPINLLASYVPILGSLVGGATFLVALAATLVVGPTVIAVAWFAVRPLLSIGLIAGGVILALGLRQLRRRPAATVAPAPA